MYVTNMEDFIDEAKDACSSDYKHDFGLILTEYELETLNYILDEYIESVDIIKAQSAAQINTQIREFFKRKESIDE